MKKQTNHLWIKRFLCLVLAVVMLPLASFSTWAVPADANGEPVNFALGQTITATSNYVPPEGFFNVTFLNDGEWLTIEGANVKLGWNTDTYVPLGETDPVDITLPLDSTYELEKVVIKPMKWGNGETFPRDFELQGSLDGETWFPVYEAQENVSAIAADNNSVQPKEYTMDTPKNIKYFRIHITKHSTIKDASGAYTSALGELELWGVETDEPAGDTKENIALNKAATSSHNHEEPPYYALSMLTDGVWVTNNTLGWFSGFVSQDTVTDVTLNFGKLYSVDKIVLKPMQWSEGTSFPKDFELQLSEDGAEWTTVATVTDADVSVTNNTDVQPQEYTFEAVNAQYARIHITEHPNVGGSYYSQIGEWEVYGVEAQQQVPETLENLALNKLAASNHSKTEGGYYAINLLTDGTWGTLSTVGTLGWNSNNVAQDTEVDITLDLSALCSVEKMVLKPAQWSKGAFFPKDFELQVSTDNETWNTVATVTDADASAESDTAVVPQEYSFDAVDAKYARIHITEHNYSETFNTYWSEIGEWEVWGVKKVYTKDELAQIVADAKAMDTSAYTLESIGLLNVAIANAEALIAAENPAADDLAAAVSAIEAAVAGLVEKGESINFALNQTITATNNYIPPEGFFNVTFLNDGEWLTVEGENVKLGWNTDPYIALGENDPVDITLKLDSSYALEKIVLKPMKWGNGETFPRGFELQGSLDGETWFPVYAAQENVSAEAADNASVVPKEYTLDTPVRIKYFRLHITQQSAVQDTGTGHYSSALGELELYGYEDGAEIKETTINKSALRMNPGETDWVELVVDRHNPTPEVTYSSNNEAVATVDADGTVHAIAVGNAVITTKDVTNNKSYETTVQVDTFRVEDQFNIVTFMPYFWAEEVNADYFDDLQASGITNVELNFAFDANAITYENNLKAIELAHERGMDVTVSEADFTNATWPSKTDEEIVAFVKKYSHRPGVTGFYIEDESGTSWIYARQMAKIKEIMPYAVTHVNYCGAYADNVRQLYNELKNYGEGLLDYVMYDVYVFRNEVCDENSLYTWLEYNRNIGQELNTPTACYIQSMDWNGCYRPNGDDVRYQIWAGLAYGVKQYSFFCYHTPRANQYETYGPAIVDLNGNPTDLFEPVSKINWQVRAIGDTLMKLTTKVVYHSGASFGGSYNELPAGYYLQPVDRDQKLTISRMVHENGQEYGILVNRDYNNAQTVKFTLAEAVESISYISTETGEPVLMTADADGVYTVELAAGEGVLLQLDEDYEYYLEEITDFYHLEKAIEAAEALDLDKYKPDGKGAFQSALAAAKVVAANTEATQEEVDAARSALETAQSVLKMYAAEGANLALKRPVTATSSYQEGTYFMKEFLTDGVHVPLDQNSHAGWSVDPFAGLAQDSAVDITVELDDNYLIEGIVLRPAIYNNGVTFPQDYTVEVSEDKETWTKVGEGVGVKLTTAADQNYTVDSVKAKFVRVHITRHSETRDAGTAGYLSQIGEIEVYGKDVVSAEAELANAKAAAKGELETYRAAKNDADYRDAQVAELDAALNAGKEAVDAVSAISEIAAVVDSAKDAMDAVKTDAQLTAEEDAVAQQAAEQVNQKIDALGTVTLNSQEAIEEARAAYEALSEDAKAYVTKLDILEAAEDTLEELIAKAEAEEELAATKEAAIAELEAYRAALNDADYREEQIAELDAALKAAKKAVNNGAKASEVAAAVTAAKKAMEEVKTDAQLKAEEEQEKAETAKKNAEAVSNAISKLPATVEPDDEATAEKILAAKKAYDALSADEKALVSAKNKQKLEALVKSLTDYKVIKGDGSKWTVGDEDDIVITFNGPFSKFVGLEVNGKKVDETFYEAKSGSTIITLKQSYLKNLSKGEYEITVLYIDGEASATFEIAEQAKDQTQAATPSTGDFTNLMGGWIMLCVALLGAGALLLMRKRSIVE